MATGQPQARKTPVTKAIDAVVSKPYEVKEATRTGSKWEWGNNYSEIDGRIEAPCWLILWDDDTLEGYMSNCKNAGNPFTLAFYFEIEHNGVWYGWRTCTRDYLEGGSASINTTASYAMFGGRSARRNITY